MDAIAGFIGGGLGYIVPFLAVLTVEDRRQALVRSVIDGDVVGDNKGSEAADAALEMAVVLDVVTAI